MTKWRRRQGDVNDTVEVRLDGGVDDLVTATGVEGQVRYNGAAAEILTGTLNPVTRVATLNLGDATGWLSDAALGCWALRTVVSFPAGGEKSWPEGPADEIEVFFP